MKVRAQVNREEGATRRRHQRGRPPRVSVIVPTYNRAKYLAEAVESVLVQDYVDYEILIIDDGSTDDTQEVVRRFPGELVRYHHQRNAGPSAARNTGLGLARGELVAFLDSDDRWLPDKLGPQVALFDEFPELVLTAANIQHFDESGLLDRFHTNPDQWEHLPGEEVRPDVFYISEPRDPMLGENWVPGGSVVARREVILEVGGFDKDLWCGEDYDLWLRLSARGPFVLERRVVYLYRQHEGTLNRRDERRHSSRIRVLEKALAEQQLSYRQRRVLRRRIAGRHKLLGDSLRASRNYAAARSEYAAALRVSVRPRPLLLFAYTALMSMNPWRVQAERAEDP